MYEQRFASAFTILVPSYEDEQVWEILFNDEFERDGRVFWPRDMPFREAEKYL